VELRYDHGDVTPMTRVAPFGGLGVDRSNRDHLRGFGVSGTMFESFDGGATWQTKGTIPGTPVVAAVFDPSDFDHILVGLSRGFTVTRDGGASWKPDTSIN